MKYPNERYLTQVAKGAGKILLKYLNKKHSVSIKADTSIVTEADKAAEKYILKKISTDFPNCSIISEESGEFVGREELVWLIDPLDGTSNYAHNFPWFSVSIGLWSHGKPLMGVVYHPVLDELFYAEKGKGAYLNGKRIRVSETKKLSEALLTTGFYYSRGATLAQEMKLFWKMNELALGVRRPGSAALDLAYVACGRFDAFWERGLSVWDVAAGYLLVEEAGGKLTDYKGKPATLAGAEVVATNKSLNGQIVSITKGISRIR